MSWRKWLYFRAYRIFFVPVRQKSLWGIFKLLQVLSNNVQGFSEFGLYLLYLPPEEKWLSDSTRLWLSMQKSQMWNYDYMRSTMYKVLKYLKPWFTHWWCIHPVFKIIQEMVNSHDHSLNSSPYSSQTLKSKSIFVHRKVSRVSTKAMRQKLYESSLTGTIKDKKSLHSTLFAYSLICVPDCKAAT